MRAFFMAAVLCIFTNVLLVAVAALPSLVQPPDSHHQSLALKPM